MLKTVLTNPDDGVKQRIDPSRAALVSQRPVPPFGVSLDAIVFRTFLTNEAGSNDMAVVATPANPSLFSVRASSTLDTYIKSLSFLITGTTMDLGLFGDQPALTDPCILTYETLTFRVVLADDITTNFDLLRLGGEPMPGVGAVGSNPPDALKMGSPAQGASTDDAYVAFIDFARVYGFPWGIRLAAGTEQRFDFLVQSDLSAIPTFDCNAFGFLRGPDTEGS